MPNPETTADYILPLPHPGRDTEIAAKSETDFTELRKCLQMFNLSTVALDRIQTRFARRSGALHDIELQSTDPTAVEVAREALAT